MERGQAEGSGVSAGAGVSAGLGEVSVAWRLRRRPKLRRDLHMTPSFSEPSRWMAREPYTRRVYELDPLAAVIARAADGTQTLAAILDALRAQPPEGVAPEDLTAEAALERVRWLDERMLLHSPKLPHWLARRGGVAQAVRLTLDGLLEVERAPADPDPATIQARPDLRYTCLSCGACCSGRYRVGLLPSDLDTLQGLDLQGALGLSLSDCVEPLSAPTAPPSGPSLDDSGDQHPAPRLALRRDAQGRCVLLQDGRWCGLHRAFGYASKPYSCRSFPFDALTTPAGPLLRYRPECSSQHKTRTSGELQAPHKAQLWASLTTEQPWVRGVPAVLPLNEQRDADFDTYQRLLNGWVSAARANGWRASLRAMAADLLPPPGTPDTPSAPAPARPFAVLAEHLLRDIARGVEPSSHTLDRLTPDAERDPLLWPTLLASVGVVLPEHQALSAEVAPLLARLREVLLDLDADASLHALLTDYTLNALLGHYLMAGLSVLSGAGLLSLALLGARHTAAWMVARYGLPLDAAPLNESLIFWHMLAFDERPLRAHLLLRAISGVESLVLLG